ncbi:M15 family metallopeptidase [Luteipulveratus halotolerans]|uniref:M15 family metallopeptidase n=1 Tax=Luteipulveratus halotolerans TaxID=1631356 RepID=UPI0006828FBF|nr:M15 family metallopeptidase [Luteipulveratus halotolerans]
MDAAFVRDTGTHLVQDLTYRDYAEQVYWYDVLGYPRAAAPGTSNHGFGTAIDVWESSSSPFRFEQAGDAWLTGHGAAYGWDRPAFMDAGGSNPEYWHYNYTG